MKVKHIIIALLFVGVMPAFAASKGAGHETRTKVRYSLHETRSPHETRSFIHEGVAGFSPRLTGFSLRLTQVALTSKPARCGRGRVKAVERWRWMGRMIIDNA